MIWLLLAMALAFASTGHLSVLDRRRWKVWPGGGLALNRHGHIAIGLAAAILSAIATAHIPSLDAGMVVIAFGGQFTIAALAHSFIYASNAERAHRLIAYSPFLMVAVFAYAVTN